jgi:hypothetical protein
LGGRYQLEGNAGGEIAACEPPHHLAVTWEFGEDTTWVEVHLVEDPAGGARLELEHTVPATGEHWDQFGPGAVGIGWELGLMGLDLHLSSGAPVDPDAVAAWQVTDDAKAYTVTSSDGWCQADVAGGTPEAAARAAADRTTSAYTGDPADPGPG